MRTGLGADDLSDLLGEPLIGVLATRRPDDSIMLSPVWWEWRDGGFNVWVDAETDRKIRHIRRDPRVTFVVANQTWPYKGFEIRAEATVSSDDFYGVLGRTAEHYQGPDDAKEMVDTYAEGLVIRIEPGQPRGWSYAAEGED
ncbi:MAG: pyridoxamine 5'-phosphate oxidase family protein [Candidatus Limnocylindrales bacterium]